MSPEFRSLDLATGTGLLAGAFSERGHTVSGLDFADKLLKRARRQFPRFDFRHFDLPHLDRIEAGCYDLVSMGYFLHGISPDFRLFPPGGTLHRRHRADGGDRLSLQRRGGMRTLILTYPTSMEYDAPLAGKFLQLRLAARDYLLCATVTEYRYHNQILARFLSEQGIPHRWEGEEKLVVDRPELVVTGGGRFRLDVIGKSLHVWDDSSVYGPFDPSRLAAQLASAGPPWDRLVLSVG